MSNPIIAPIFDEWWKKSNLVVTSNQQREDVKSAFYAGALVAMGMVARANRMANVMDAEAFVRDMHHEINATLMPNKMNGVKKL